MLKLGAKGKIASPKGLRAYYTDFNLYYCCALPMLLLLYVACLVRYL